MAARAPSDGYTLLIHSGSITYDPSLHDRLPYDTMKDLAPVTMIGTGVPSWGRRRRDSSQGSELIA
jgi:tripartite-type tricarboxylate transporter receptor subunit TctC